MIKIHFNSTSIDLVSCNTKARVRNIFILVCEFFVIFSSYDIVVNICEVLAIHSLSLCLCVVYPMLASIFSVLELYVHVSSSLIVSLFSFVALCILPFFILVLMVFETIIHYWYTYLMLQITEDWRNCNTNTKTRYVM